MEEFDQLNNNDLEILRTLNSWLEKGNIAQFAEYLESNRNDYHFYLNFVRNTSFNLQSVNAHNPNCVNRSVPVINLNNYSPNVAYHSLRVNYNPNQVLGVPIPQNRVNQVGMNNFNQVGNNFIPNRPNQNPPQPSILSGQNVYKVGNLIVRKS